jgi:NitT/TauT family transport system ATP-binding protein
VSAAAVEDDAAAIEIRDVSLAYGDHLVIKNVSVKIGRGEFVSLIGPSGCGKSTLLSMVAGLTTPGRGEVRVVGQPVTGPGSPHQAMVFQSFALLPWLTVRDNVALGTRFRARMSRNKRYERCQEFIDLVGLTGFEHHYTYQLSGGMQQRVGLARAFAAEPSVLLMDEPFGALDAQTAELMREEVRELTRSAGKTVLFVTHSLDEALYLSDRVLMMTTGPGQIVEDVPIVLPAERGLHVEDADQRLRYAAYRTQLWDHLRAEVMRARRLTEK